MNKVIDMLDNFDEAVGASRLKDLIVGVANFYGDLPTVGVAGKLYLVRSDVNSNNNAALYIYENGVYSKASGGVPPETLDRITALENTTSTTIKSFTEDFKTQNLIDKSRTDATTGSGFVRTDKLSSFMEDYSTTNYLDTPNSSNVAVDTAAKKLSLTAGAVSGIGVSTTIATQGTKYATLNASVNHKNVMAFSAYTKQSSIQLTADHTAPATVVDRVGRTWLFWQVYPGPATTAGIYAKVINTDGSEAFNGQLVSLDIRTSTSTQFTPTTKVVVDIDNKVWVLVYCLSGSSISHSAGWFVVNTDFTLFKSYTAAYSVAPGASGTYHGYCDMILDRNNRIWITYGQTYNSNASFYAIFNADGTTFLAQTVVTNAGNNITTARFTYDSIRDKIVWVGKAANSYLYVNGYSLTGVATLTTAASVAIATSATFSNFLGVTYGQGTDKIIIYGMTSSKTLNITTVNPTDYKVIAQTPVAAVSALVDLRIAVLNRQTDILLAYPTTVDNTTAISLHVIGLKEDGTVSVPDMNVNLNDASTPHQYPTLYTDSNGNLRVSYSTKKYSTYFTIEEAAYVNTPSTISFAVSVDDGLSWLPATPGQQITFGTSGNKLRVKMNLAAPAVGYGPDVISYSIVEGNDTTNTGVTRTFYSSPLPSVTPIMKASLSAIVDLSGGGSVDWFLSNDGGANWNPITLATLFTFPNGLGTDLRVKAVLTYPVTATTPPVINSYSVSSYVIKSGETAVTRVACEFSALYTSNQALVASTLTKLSYTNKIRDTHNLYDNTNNQFVIPRDGWYMVSVSTLIQNNFTTPMRVYLSMYKNNINAAALGDWVVSAVDNVGAAGSTPYYLAYGDIVDFRIWAGKATNIATTVDQPTGDHWNYIRIIEMV